MLKFIDSMARIPPGNYDFIHPEDGHITECAVLSEAKKEARRYRAINHFPISVNFDAEFEDQCCRRKPPGFCVDTEARTAYVPLHRHPLTALEVISGTKFLVDYMLKGEVAPDDEVERRIAICIGCPANVPFDTGCFGCASSQSAHKIMEAAIAKKPFRGDERLRACYYCGCSNKAQTRVKLELVQKHLTPEINEMLPSACWKRKG